MKRDRRMFFVLAVLITLTLAASAGGAFAFSCRVSGAEAGAIRLFCAKSLLRPANLFDKEQQYLSASASRVHAQPPLPADETSEESEGAGKGVFDRRGTSASDERILCLPKIFLPDRFLRERSAESAAVKPAAAIKVSAGVLSKFEAEPSVILLLPTQIAVRK